MKDTSIKHKIELCRVLKEQLTLKSSCISLHLKSILEARQDKRSQYSPSFEHNPAKIGEPLVLGLE